MNPPLPPPQLFYSAISATSTTFMHQFQHQATSWASPIPTPPDQTTTCHDLEGLDSSSPSTPTGAAHKGTSQWTTQTDGPTTTLSRCNHSHDTCNCSRPSAQNGNKHTKHNSKGEQQSYSIPIRHSHGAAMSLQGPPLFNLYYSLVYVHFTEARLAITTNN